MFSRKNASKHKRIKLIYIFSPEWQLLNILWMLQINFIITAVIILKDEYLEISSAILNDSLHKFYIYKI